MRLSHCGSEARSRAEVAGLLSLNWTLLPLPPETRPSGLLATAEGASKVASTGLALKNSSFFA